MVLLRRQLGDTESLFQKDLLLLFFLSMSANSFIAVFYCFEQWLNLAKVAPNMRGLLLSILFAMVLILRMPVSIFLLTRAKHLALRGSIIICSLCMISYSFAEVSGHFELYVAIIRIVQGLALAVFSTCVTMILVSCIPPGQSARAFALFSLTTLLPYSLIPAISELILPYLSGEAELFAMIGIIGGLSSLLASMPLSQKALARPEVKAEDIEDMQPRAIIKAILHSGLIFIFLACMFFSIMNQTIILFMKGLASLKGNSPEQFFLTYTTVIIVIRILGAQLLDTLPRVRITALSAIGLSMGALGMAWLDFAFPFYVLHGICLAFIYPLLAATIHDRSTPHSRSINSNVMMLTFDASCMCGPIIGGFVIAFGGDYRVVFSVAAIFTICCFCSIIYDAIKTNHA